MTHDSTLCYVLAYPKADSEAVELHRGTSRLEADSAYTAAQQMGDQYAEVELVTVTTAVIRSRCAAPKATESAKK